jgi:uncharacterized YccA/Bax inhibitor family protein
MESTNPVLKRGYQIATTSNQLEDLYNSPAASATRTGRMTIDDVVARTGLLFAVLVTAGAVAWTGKLDGLMLPAIIGALIFSMVLTFSKRVKPWAAVSYAALEGIALGVISHYYEAVYPGIVSQAIIGTIGAFVGILFAYKTKRIRVSEKFNRMMGAALIGYLVIGLASFVASMFGMNQGFGFYKPHSSLALLLCVAGVGLATFFLVVDFDQIEKMIAAGAPHEEAWRAGFGLMVTVVWLYMEVLRLLSILRSNNN